MHMLSHAHGRMFSIAGLSLLFYWLLSECCRIIGPEGGRGERARWITGVLTCYSGVSQGGGTMEGVSQLTLSTKGERSKKKKPQTLNPRCDFIQGEP